MSHPPPSEHLSRVDNASPEILGGVQSGGSRVRPEVPPTDLEDSEISQLANMFWRRKGIIAAVTVLLVLAAAAIISVLPASYEASAVILLNTRPTTIVDLPAATVRQLMGGAEADIGVIHSEMAVIRSPQLAQTVVERLHLLDNNCFWGRCDQNDAAQDSEEEGSTARVFVRALRRIHAAWTGLTGKQGTRSEPDMDTAVRQLSRNLSVTSDPRSYVIRVTYGSKDPALAVAIANALAEAYLGDQLAGKREAVQRANGWLNDRVTELRARINRSEGALERFKYANGLSEVRGVTVNAQQLAELNSQLIVATSDRAQKETALRQIEALKAGKGVDAAAHTLASPVIQSLQEQQSVLARRHAELASRLGPSHPEMIALDAEQLNVRKRIAGEVDGKVKALAGEVSAAQARESSLRRSLAQLQQVDSALGEKRVELRQLEQEAEANRLLFASLLNRSKAIENEGMQQADARIIGVAAVPSEPAFPQRKLMLFLASVGSLLVGLTVGFGCEVFDRTFRSVRQLERITMRPCIGLAPHFTRSASADELALRRHTSPYVDAVRSIRIALGRTSPAPSPQVVLVTSAVPEEGKSIFALSLARSAAQAGYRSLLVDCDLRNPSVGRLMRPAQGVDLISFCQSANADDTALTSIDTELDPISGMCFIPTTGRSKSPQDLLNSPEMREFLNRMRRGYDLIVLDTPPVLAATDALVLSHLADTTVFLARWGMTPRAVTIHALRMLAREGVNVAGTVLSRVDLRKYRLYGTGEHGHFLARYASYYCSKREA